MKFLNYFLFFTLFLIIKSKRKFIIQTPKKIRQEIQQFMESGQHVDLVEYLETILKKKGNYSYY